jgi:hypothetical protein
MMVDPTSAGSDRSPAASGCAALWATWSHAAISAMGDSGRRGRRPPAAPARSVPGEAGGSATRPSTERSNPDCPPVGLCLLPDGKEGLLLEGACRPLPWDKVLGVASPDDGAHACWYWLGGRPRVRCVILPGEA